MSQIMKKTKKLSLEIKTSIDDKGKNDNMCSKDRLSYSSIEL